MLRSSSRHLVCSIQTFETTIFAETTPRDDWITSETTTAESQTTADSYINPCFGVDCGELGSCFPVEDEAKCFTPDLKIGFLTFDRNVGNQR